MEKYTREGLKGSWGDMKIVEARSKRGPGTSAPIEEELEIYEEFFKIAIGNKKKTRNLVLGGTPELRDLALKYGSETIAVDISPKLLLALTNVMEHKNEDNNKFMIGDWLDMGKFLQRNSFDIILADLSINNIPFEKWESLFNTLKKLLKKKGYFIIRHINYNQSKKFKDYKKIIDDFNSGKNTLLGLVFECGFCTGLSQKAYNTNKKEFVWKSVIDELNILRDMLDKKDAVNFDNLTAHAKYHTSIATSEKEFHKLIRKYFWIKKIGIINKLVFSHYMPIYLLRTRC